jgi:predicted GTPase
MTMATQSQIKKIHALKSELKLDDREYRSMLESYLSPDGIPLWSSKDLSYDQASSLIRTITRATDRKA